MHKGRGGFFFSSRRRHTRWNCDWSSDVCSSDLTNVNKILEGDPEITRRYSQLVGEFHLMKELALHLNARRSARGSIDFDLPEIGRASCRERVSISVVAARIKNERTRLANVREGY